MKLKTKADLLQLNEKCENDYEISRELISQAKLSMFHEECAI